MIFYGSKQVKSLLVCSVLALITLSSTLSLNLHRQTCRYRFPDEAQPHEATWLQWPHEHQYGQEYSEPLQQVWVDMTKALIQSEKVRIIVYDEDAEAKVQSLLEAQSSEEQLSLIGQNVEFFIHPTDDVWVRDNGPIFVKDCQGNIVVQDWGFNAWGKKAQFKKCDKIPSLIAADLGLEVVKVNMINEGGSVEIDGKGTMMGCRSSITNKNRNPNLSEAQIENIFRQYYGVEHFLWLDGVAGKDITDMHIDGFARFVPENSILTMSKEDLEYWEVPQKDIETLHNSVNSQG